MNDIRIHNDEIFSKQVIQQFSCCRQKKNDDDDKKEMLLLRVSPIKAECPKDRTVDKGR